MEKTLLLALLVSINSWGVTDTEIEKWADHLEKNKDVVCLIRLQKFMGINPQIDAMVVSTGTGNIYEGSGANKRSACLKLAQVVVLTRHLTVPEALRMD